MHGTELASHCSETGLVMSGVDEVSTRSTPSVLISSAATSPARAELDCESFTMISTVCSVPSTVTGLSANHFSIASIT